MLCRNAVAMHESLHQTATVDLVPLGMSSCVRKPTSWAQELVIVNKHNILINGAIHQQADSRATDWHPQLRAADVELSTDAAGRRIVLGGGAFGTVDSFVLFPFLSLLSFLFLFFFCI